MINASAFIILFFLTILKNNTSDLKLSKKINLTYRDEHYLTKILRRLIFSIYRYNNVRELDGLK